MPILLDAVVFVNEVFVLILLIEGFYTLTSNYISEVKLIEVNVFVRFSKYFASTITNKNKKLQDI